MAALGSAWAAGGVPAGEPVRAKYSVSTIYTEKDAIAPGETLWVGLQQELPGKWHVFWINPGDAGLPLALDWNLPDGFETGEILHPVPEVAPIGPLANFVHLGAPVFLVPVTAPDNLDVGEEIDVRIEGTWQVCEEICVPEDGVFEFTLPVLDSPAVIPENASLFENARTQLPGALGDVGVFTREGENFRLTVPWSEGENVTDVFFFPEPEGLVEPAAVQSATIENGEMTIAMAPGFMPNHDGETVSGLLAFERADGRRNGLTITAAFDNSGAASAPIVAVPAAGGTGLPLLVLMAFAGGVILNLMPCVFPIIFVKAAHLMKAAHGDQGAIRRHGLLYTGGVLATFAAMGAVLLALRAGGEQLGWGFHLQSPAVVLLSAYVLFLVGLNLGGVFHAGESLQGAGASLAGKSGAAGSFFTGALAVVVAAPCIGPLLSAPMGAALLQPAAIGMLIFMVMALGLAAPYLALSFAPQLGRLLPKPGDWMQTFKQLLAFPVFAAAAYFVWVFSRQTGSNGLGLVLGGLILLGFAAWAFEKSKADGAGALALRALAGLAAVFALAPLWRLEPLEAASAAPARFGAFLSEPYDEDAIRRHNEAGRAVFVDFTADWCVTCQFDKLTIFSDENLARQFDEKQVVFMVADWTVRDPIITAALEKFGASGVPFYAYYPAGGAPQALPPPISKQQIVNILNQ